MFAPNYLQMSQVIQVHNIMFKETCAHYSYLLGTGSSDFGSLGIVVCSLNQIRSLIGPFSRGTEFGGRGFSFEP